MSLHSPSTRRLTLVTGPSGAGRSSALNALEDLGVETIDNLPLSLVPALLDSGGLARDMALGIDLRTRDFSPDAMTDLLADVAARMGHPADLLFLDADRDVLIRRYSETRRRHPSAPDSSPRVGIARELELLNTLREQATILIDTSNLSPHDLRAEIHRLFASDTALGLAVSLMSFSYKRGLPRGADIVLDCRFLRNPHWEPALRPLDGRNARVASHVALDTRYAEFRQKAIDLLLFQLPTALEEGKSHFTVAFGCTGGKHRSVTMAETIADGLAQEGWLVSIRHRKLEHRTIPDEPSIEVGQETV